MSSVKKTIGVALITYRAKNQLQSCLKPLKQSSIVDKILLLNSSSQDGTVELARALGVDTLVIPRQSFNHGETRDLARKTLATDIVVFMTPDALLKDAITIEKLVSPIQSNLASLSYARQIPHLGADFFEAFPREFNYPEKSHIRGMEDLPEWGSYLTFCSNSTAAYSQRALDEIGGFGHVFIGEDAIAAAKLLQRGHKIAYVAEAVVHHSHRYSLKQEFKRCFDTGLARKEQEALFSPFGCDEKRGEDFVLTMCKRLIREKPSLLPYAILQNATKYAGYLLGRLSLHAPRNFKKYLSSQDFYWQ